MDEGELGMWLFWPLPSWRGDSATESPVQKMSSSLSSSPAAELVLGLAVSGGEWENAPRKRSVDVDCLWRIRVMSICERERKRGFSGQESKEILSKNVIIIRQRERRICEGKGGKEIQ